MAIEFLDLIEETTGTTGTGDYLLDGAVSAARRPFSDVGDGVKVPYVCSSDTAFELGVGTYHSGTNTLSRTTILKNSLGTTAAINWTSGTRSIYSPILAERWIAGTTNQVIVTTDETTLVDTLSLPQSIHAGASPNFAGLIVTEGSTPSTPASGKGEIYVDSSSHHPMFIDSSGTTFDLITGGGAIAFDDLTDVVITSATTGDVVYYNGTNWVNADLATAGIAAASHTHDASTDLTGVVPIANGGTHSSTALSNDRIMVSSGGAIVEASALTDGQLLIGSTGAAPAAATLTAGSGISITNAAGAITVTATSSGGSVTSVDLTAPTEITVSGNPITTSGTLALTWTNQTQNLVFASPDGSTGTPTFRAIAATDLPTHYHDAADIVSGVLAVANGGTNSSTTLNNDRVMVSNAGSIVEAAALTDGQLLIGSTGAAPVAATLTAGSGITINNTAGGIEIIAASGGGSVTSVALSMPSFMQVTGSPVTTSGTLTATLLPQSVNTVFAGPSSGASAAPTFRKLSSLDLPISSLTLFGDGSDGNVTVSSGTTTLSRDMYYNNLTMSGTGKIVTNGYRIFVSGTLTLTNAAVGAISYNGSAASGVTEGAALLSRSIGGSGVGGATNGGNGGAANNGAYGGFAAGGAGGSIGAIDAFPVRRIAIDLLKGASVLAGGSGGAGAPTVTGGAGGSGGGVIAIYARNITRGGSNTGVITAKGGNGGNGSPGGGGGGGGGWIYIVYEALLSSSMANAINANGGSGGNGTSSSGGGGGGGGRITLINTVAGTISETFGGNGVGNSGATGGAGGTCQVTL